MTSREQEINMIVDLIHKMCVEAEISLLPYENKHGVKMVIVEDNTTNKQYAITKPDKTK